MVCFSLDNTPLSNLKDMEWRTATPLPLKFSTSNMHNSLLLVLHVSTHHSEPHSFFENAGNILLSHGISPFEHQKAMDSRKRKAGALGLERRVRARAEPEPDLDEIDESPSEFDHEDRHEVEEGFVPTDSEDGSVSLICPLPYVPCS